MTNPKEALEYYQNKKNTEHWSSTASVVNNYITKDELYNYVKDDKKNGILLAIVGPSAAGKDTLAKALEKKYGWPRLVSDTSRPMRKNEKDGVDYNFISKQEFMDKIENKEYLEWTTFKKWFYGTPVSQLKNNKISIGVFNIEGMSRLHRTHNNIKIVPIYVDDPFLTRLKRSIKRENKFKVEFLRRGVVDGMSFAGFRTYLDKCYSYYIDMSENDWTIDQMVDRIDFMLRRWSILDNQ